MSTQTKSSKSFNFFSIQTMFIYKSFLQAIIKTLLKKKKKMKHFKKQKKKKSIKQRKHMIDEIESASQLLPHQFEYLKRINDKISEENQQRRLRKQRFSRRQKSKRRHVKQRFSRRQKSKRRHR